MSPTAVIPIYQVDIFRSEFDVIEHAVVMRRLITHPAITLDSLLWESIILLA